MQNKKTHSKNLIKMTASEAMEISIFYEIYDTSCGKALIATTDKGVCFVALGEERFMYDELMREYPFANLVKQSSDLQYKCLSYINEPTGEIEIPLHIRGTEFQIKVWNELLKIEPGQIKSYKQIAENVGVPKAARAVGTAVGQNPISCLIPCHRVIRSDKTLGGYHWGIDIKKKLLEFESLN